MITEQISRVDLVEVVQDAGVELRSAGGRYVGLCPFHPEEKPSFFVFPDNKFHCFSCHAHGDSVDFIQHLTGCDFNQALCRLGIKGNQPRAEIHKAIMESRRRIREKKKRIQRERDLIHTLAILIRSTHKAMAAWRSIDDFDRSGEILQPLCWLEHCHDVLARGDHGEKDQVIDALQDMVTISRAYLWTGKFNYKEWLRNFLNGEKNVNKQDPGSDSKAERKICGCQFEG